MKTLLLLLLPILSYCQIGIKTANPTAMLDVNGNARIRNIPAGNQTDSLLVVNSGFIRKISLSSIQNSCPNLIKNQCSGYYLLFKGSTAILNPNNPLVIQGKTFISAGTWISNNEYFFSYSNTTGSAINLNNLSVNFSGQICNY